MFNMRVCVCEGGWGDKDKDKNLSVKKFLDRIKPYLINMINNHKVQEKNGEFIQTIK